MPHPLSGIKPPQTQEDWIAIFELLRDRTASGNLGVKLVSINSDSIILELEISNKTRQPYGLLHGGVSLLLAETAASFHSSWGLDFSQLVPVGTEVSGSHLRSAHEGHIQAVGTIIKKGRTSIIHNVDIIHVETEKLLSVVRVTNQLIQR